MDRTPTPLIGDITDRLVTAIASGEFLPGARLPAERDLAVLLGVGRTSVRAALAGLHDRGLIETSRGRSGGSFVRTQWTEGTEESVLHVLGDRWDEISDRLEASRRLTGAIARAAAERRSDEDLDLLEQRLLECRASSDALGAQLADAALHDAVTDAARVDTLKALLLDLEGELTIGTHLHVWGEPGGDSPEEDRVRREHEALVSAIRDRRPADAEAIALEHGRLDLELLEATRQRAERGASS